MRKSSDGRDKMLPGGNTRRVMSLVDAVHGVIISVDTAARTVTVRWEHSDFPVVYPDDSKQLRELLPWE